MCRGGCLEEAVLKGSKGDWAWRKAETGPRDMEPMSCVQDCEQRGVVGAGCTHQGEWRKTHGRQDPGLGEFMSRDF